MSESALRKTENPGPKHNGGERVIAFDLDGTLIDTAPDLIGTLNEILGRHRIRPLPYEGARAMIGGGVKVLLEKGLIEQGLAFTPDELNALYAEYLELYRRQIAVRSRPFPGLITALDVLEGEGFRFAVCTNKLESLSKQLLDELELSPRFAAICGQDTFGTPKPHPDMLTKTVRMAGGEPIHAIMVGDSITDIDTARAAGVPVIAVDFGYTEKPIDHFNPDLIISRFADLPDAVRKVTNRAVVS